MSEQSEGKYQEHKGLADEAWESGAELGGILRARGAREERELAEKQAHAIASAQAMSAHTTGYAYDVAPSCLREATTQEYGTTAQLGALYGALAVAQGAFEPIGRTKTVTIRSAKGAYSFDYATMDELLARTRPALAANGLAVVFSLAQGEKGRLLRTILAHKDGGRLISTVDLPHVADVKEFGGAVTYLRRYAYSALLCLPGGEDLDDMPETSRGETGASSAPREARQARQAQASGTGQQGAPSQASPQQASKPAQEGPGPISEAQKETIRELCTKLGATTGPGRGELVQGILRDGGYGEKIHVGNVENVLAALRQKVGRKEQEND